MKVISLWQPYATLAVSGYKRFETRPFPPPSALAPGERLAIAATKQIKTEQQIVVNAPRLQRYYSQIGLPEWRTLVRGCIVGTVLLGEAFVITAEAIAKIDEQEYVFGDWRDGRWAWPLLDPIALATPIPMRGRQGIWNYAGEILAG